MFSKIFLLFAYFNSTKPIIDNRKALAVYHPPKCALRPTPTYLELINPRVDKICLSKHSKISKASKDSKDNKDNKKNRTNLRG